MRKHALALLARVAAALLVIGTLSGSLVVSCSGDPSSSTGGGGTGSNAPASRAMGQWTPATQDTCTKAFHDTFFVLGPDGKKYPTWHPAQATDPATKKVCNFGHEHGADPSLSALWSALQNHFGYDANNNGTLDTAERAVSGIPFGYAAEQLANAGTVRIEDHTGYKVTFANNYDRTVVSGGNSPLTTVRCQLFTAYNQPTSTADPFASNLFSVIYATDCTGGAANAPYPVQAIVSLMGVYGTPGQFTLDANNAQQGVAQLPDPANSPQPTTADLGRLIPSESSVFPAAFVTAGNTSSLDGLADRWQTTISLRRADNTELARLLPSFRVTDPARYYSQGAAANLARSIGLCYSGLNAAGNLVTDPLLATTIVRQVRGSTSCAGIAPNGPSTPADQRIAFDDPVSPFRGCLRSTSFNTEVVTNPGPGTTWYTTALGFNASTVPSANSVKQLLAVGSTNGVVLAPARFGDQLSCASSVHVPN
jgi:hypothetical protein